ncbi:hypothetical protein BDV96DRAFT_457613, partial [Lophiotrema nucula]
HAILSHTWGDEEVTYQDVRDPAGGYYARQGYAKLRNFLSKSLTLGFSYAWIDTGCVDKSSSAELSEAINSMFNWYKNDAQPILFRTDDGCVELACSRWLTSGWTLQELVAPSKIKFFD